MHLLQTRVVNLQLVAASYKNNYQLVTSGPIDREQTSTISVQLVCRDRGQPSLKTVRDIVIGVGDVNDNAPRFTQSTYNVSVVENQRPTEVRSKH